MYILSNQKLCKQYIQKESEKSPIKYQFSDDGNIVQIKQRYDKEILEELPKLKFLNKAGIRPDYEDKDIEKPALKPKIWIFSGIPSDRQVKIRTDIEHSLDMIGNYLITYHV